MVIGSLLVNTLRVCSHLENFLGRSFEFEIPPSNRTADPRQVKKWHKELLAGELFENLPCDGIVVKVASGATKQRLSVTSVCPNWALALKD